MIRSEGDQPATNLRSGLILGQIDVMSLAGYYLTLGLVVIASLFPQSRLWGLNWWAFMPVWLSAVSLVVAVVLPMVLAKVPIESAFTRSISSRLMAFTTISLLLLAVLFYLGRSRTHFLGDGYLVLGLLESHDPFLKPTELGSSLVVASIRDMLDAIGINRPGLWSFQLLSMASGLAFVLAVIWGSRRIFTERSQRILFTFGMSSGGYMLLYFGYVEYYSLFVLAVAAFILVGIVIASGRLSRWWIVPPLLLAVFFHVLGLTLLPAAIYLVAAKSRFGSWIKRQSFVVKTASGSILAAGLVVVFVLVYSRSLFFKLAIVPLLPHEFTLSGYTQFSPSHLGDIVSQLLMLVPGLLVFAGSWAAFRAQTPMPGRSQVFLVLAALSALGSLVMLDPKLGMPRDWDLFAFAGVPIAVLTYISLLLRHRYRIALFMIALGFGLLLPRVVSQSIPDIALAHVANYMELDVYRNRMLHGTLVDYFEAQGNRAAADSVTSLWNRRFPERNEITRAMQLLDRGNYEEAISVSRYILRRNPQYSDAWSNLGVAMEYLGHYDSAVTYYRISNALNPYNPILLDNWATVYIAKRQFDKARQLLNRAENIDSTLSRIHFHRAEIAKAEKNIPDYLFHANRAISQSDALPTYFLDLGVSYLQLNQSDKAIEIFRRGVTRGLSPHTVDSLLQRYSQ